MNDELSLIITLPADVEWRDYISEILAAATGQVMNFKVSSFPTKVTVGDKCYLVHRGKIKGWMTITGFSEKEFTCTTTGKRYKGKFIERSGKFHYLDDEIPYTGFQGYRYFNYDDYKEKLRQKALDEMFNENQGDVIELGEEQYKSKISVKHINRVTPTD